MRHDKASASGDSGVDTYTTHHSSVRSVTSKPRRKRHAPKVRSGCVTCKQRRVKCDETKPVCQRCAVGDRECAGYQVPKALVFGLVNDKEEQWSFYYFRDRTSAEILTFMDHRFWNTLVIQAGHVRPIVRHALVAIGSYHEAVDHENDARRRDRQRFALQQYNKAIGCALKANGQAQVEDILLAIILFAFFENVRGEWGTALTHLQSGRRILSNLKSTPRQVHSPRAWSQTVETHLAPIFDSLHQAAACSMPLLSRCLPSDGVGLPARFESMLDARYHLQETLHTITAKLDETYQDFPWPASDSKTIVHGLQVLGQWHDKFQTYLSHAQRLCLCSGTSSGCHFELGMYHLQLQYLFARLRLECDPFRQETSFDSLSLQFEELILIAESHLQASGRPDAVGSQKCLGFEIEYIGVMSMVALRCRDPRIRREAVDVIRRGYAITGHPAHLYVPELCGYVIKLEEMKATVPWPQHCSQIPNTSRVHIVSSTLFSWDEPNHVFDICHDLMEATLVKIRVIRSGIDPATQELETHWFDRLSGNLVVQSHSTNLPKDILGFFPQTVGRDSKLWKVLGGNKFPVYLEKADVIHLCRCQTCTVKPVLLDDAEE